LADYGVIGFMLLCGVLGAVLFRLRSVYLHPPNSRSEVMALALLGVISAALAHAMFDFTFHIYANTHLLALLAGLVFSGQFSVGALQPRSWGNVWTRSLYGCGILLAVLWIAGSLHLLMRRGQYHKALEYLQLAKDRNPKTALYWQRLGQLHLKMGHVEEARRHYLEVLKLERDNQVAIIGLENLRSPEDSM
jgi:tetratricopeptide (TPR) repeat protein